jgi:hypothetical protein
MPQKVAELYACRGVQSWWGGRLACVGDSLITYVTDEFESFQLLRGGKPISSCSSPSLASTSAVEQTSRGVPLISIFDILVPNHHSTVVNEV